MTKIGIILGSTRPGRNGRAVAHWVHEHASARSDAQFELIDVADLGLPLLDEAYPPAMAHYQNDHTKAWAEKVASFDGFVVVAGEYNHSIPAALKNAFDYLFAEWNDKAVGFVSYGSAGGVRSVEHLRQVAGELKMADVRSQVALSLMTDFKDFSEFTPADAHLETLGTLLDELVSWSEALAPLRAAA